MTQEEFNMYERLTLNNIADKAKDIEVALRIHTDWEDRGQSMTMITRIRDKANEMLDLYKAIMMNEMEIKEEETEKPLYNPYEDEDEGNSQNGFEDYLGSM